MYKDISKKNLDIYRKLRTFQNRNQDGDFHSCYLFDYYLSGSQTF